MNIKPSKYQTYSYNPESEILFRTIANKKHLVWRAPFPSGFLRNTGGVKNKNYMKEKIKSLYNAGKSQAEVAKLLGVSRQRVHQVIRNYKTLDSEKQSEKMETFFNYGFKCNFCKSKINLQIHHIDNNCHNNDLDNLVCVCKRCHTNIHKIIKNRYIK